VRRLPYGSSPSINGFMTALVAAFSLQDKIEQYGAYAGIAAVFGLGVLSLLYFAQAREVKRLRVWAGRAPERAAELEARVQADAQRRAAELAARPTAPATPAAQQSAAAGPAAPGAAPATAAAAAAGAAGGPTTATKPATATPQNGTGSGAAVPPPGTEAKPGAPEAKPAEGDDKQPAEGDGKPADGDGKPAAPATPGAAPATPGATPATPGAAPATPAGQAAGTPEAKPAAPEAKPPVPAATAAAAGAPGAPPSPAPRPAAALQAPTAATSLPPRTPAGARARTGGDDGRSRGRLAAIVGGVLGVVAVLVVAGILIFGGGGGETPAPKPNTVAQPSGASGAGQTTPSKTTVKVDRKAVPLAVLNGTTVTGLARGAANKLASKGYQQPNVVTNDTTNQARGTTEIFYEPNAKAAALDVAKILGVTAAQVKPMDANARALADRALVAVFVGSDKAQ
jgi:hypothetical protein